MARTVASGFRELRRSPRAQLAELDALRACAILLVVFHHWAIVEYEAAGGPHTALQDNLVFYYGWTGVDLFFVLSGFLIGRQLWRELQRTGTIRFPTFILRRGLRIWPIYYVTLAGYALFSPIIHPAWPDWTFLSNYWYGQFVRGWSLSTEEQFYIAVPLLILLLRRRIPLAGFLWVLAGIEAIVLLNRASLIDRLAASGVPLSPPPQQLTDPIHVHMEGLLAGLVIALLSVTQPPLVARATSRSGISWTGLLAMGVATASAFTLRALDGDLFPFLALGLLFGGVTYWALRDRSILSAPLRSRVWYPISRLSYSMYLNHWWIWPASNTALVRQVQRFTGNPDVVFLLTMIAGTVLSILAAVVMFVLVEHPFLILRDRVLLRRPVEQSRG